MKPYYQHAGITIYHGDCRDVLPALKKVACVLTDPPYGIQMAQGFEGLQGFNGQGIPIPRKQYPDCWDKDRPSKETFSAVLRNCYFAMIWGGNFFADILPRSTHWIVWDKLQTMPTFSDCELCWTNSSRKSVRKVIVQWNGLLGKEGMREHPTQKPLELMHWCLEEYTDSNRNDP